MRLGEWNKTSARTTPESTDIHSLLNDARHSGARGLVMEVSSHALRLGRVDGITYDVAVFTGLSPDHLDFHSDMEDYFQAKAELFTASRARRAVICIESEWGQRLAREPAAVIAHEMGHVPRRGEHFDMAGLHFVVLHTRAGAVRWFKVSVPERAAQP